MSEFVFVSEKDLVSLQKRPEIGETFYKRFGADSFQHWRVVSHHQCGKDTVKARLVGQKAGPESIVGWDIGAYASTKVKV